MVAQKRRKNVIVLSPMTFIVGHGCFPRNPRLQLENTEAHPKFGLQLDIATRGNDSLVFKVTQVFSCWCLLSWSQLHCLQRLLKAISTLLQHCSELGVQTSQKTGEALNWTSHCSKKKQRMASTHVGELVQLAQPVFCQMAMLNRSEKPCIQNKKFLSLATVMKPQLRLNAAAHENL